MRLVAALAYVSPILVLPQCLIVQAVAAPKKSELTLEQFTHKVVAEGTSHDLNPTIAKLVDLPAESSNKLLAVLPEETSDGWLRAATVIFREAQGKEEPGRLYWLHEKKSTEGKQSYYYLTSLDGSLERAVLLEGRNGPDGKPIKGSGKVTRLDVSSKDVRTRFEDRVLGFWLKGKYRAKARSKK